jgi:hypothetical protein
LSGYRGFASLESLFHLSRDGSDTTCYCSYSPRYAPYCSANSSAYGVHIQFVNLLSFNDYLVNLHLSVSGFLY